jgi:hypothetical protein
MSAKLLKELIEKQLKDVPHDKKLQYNDLRRICKYLGISIFDSTTCSKWTGYVTNVNKINKGLYINFYFRQKKVALHRLLYSNFIGHIADDEYIKYTCENKGYCCNVNHFKKFKYHVSENNNSATDNGVVEEVPVRPDTFKLTFD